MKKTVAIILILLLTLPVAVGGQQNAVSLAAYTSLRKDLIAYWQLDEASGTRNAAFSGFTSALNLTDNNTVTQAVGKIGNAASFSPASSEYLSLADNSAMSTGDIDYTVCAWIYPVTTAAQRVILSRTQVSPATSREWSLYQDADTKFHFDIWNTAGGVQTVLWGSTYTANTWYFVCGGLHATNNQIFIQVDNGTTVTLAQTITPSDTASAFSIGAFADGAVFFDGRVDAVGFWKRVLTTAERTALYNAGSGRSFPFF